MFYIHHKFYFLALNVGSLHQAREKSARPLDAADKKTVQIAEISAELGVGGLLGGSGDLVSSYFADLKAAKPQLGAQPLSGYLYC